MPGWTQPSPRANQSLSLSKASMTGVCLASLAHTCEVDYQFKTPNLDQHIGTSLVSFALTSSNTHPLPPSHAATHNMQHTTCNMQQGAALARGGGIPPAECSSPSAHPQGGSRMALPHSPTSTNSPSSNLGSPPAASAPASNRGSGSGTTLMGFVRNRFRASMASMPLKMLGSSGGSEQGAAQQQGVIAATAPHPLRKAPQQNC